MTAPGTDPDRPSTTGRVAALLAPPPVLTERRVPWPSLARWALIGCAVLLLAVLWHVQQLGGNPLNLIQPGRSGPSAAVLHRDFPKTPFPPGSGLDGQQFYVIARNPWNLRADRHALDRPRYRLQHPLYPWLAWALHPTGGGTGLIYAMLLVGLLAAFAGALAFGALATTWRGPPWLAALFPVLPGVWLSVRVSVADALAVALAVAAIALAARRRHGWALAVAVLAVLAKEPMLVVFVGWALARRDRRAVVLAAVPTGVVVAWMVVLRLVLPGHEASTGDITWPFVGLVQAWTGEWGHGNQWVGMLCTVGALGVGLAALWIRRLRHPLSYVIALELALCLVAGHNPIGESFGAARTTLALLAFSVLALATPRPYAKATGRTAVVTGALTGVD